MSRPVIITCAVTGGADTSGKNPAVPVTPEQIARSSIDAAKAGAAIVHLHVRDPQTGKGCISPELFRDTVGRIRASGTDVILNLTTGSGGLLRLAGQSLTPASIGAGVAAPELRSRHVVELCPEICSLDMGSMNQGPNLFVNTAADVATIARLVQGAGARPELEVFDSGHIVLANEMIGRGELQSPAMFQLCLGLSWGAPATPEMMLALRNMLPPGSIWTGFGIGTREFPMVAQAMLLGGHVRVGLEDNLYLKRGVLAPSNAALVEKAVSIVEAMGESVASAAEARELLGLQPRHAGAVHQR